MINWKDENEYVNGVVNVFTFQSKAVIDILLEKEFYKADINKCREKRSYNRDIEQLDGGVPIWVFSPHVVHTKELNRFSIYDLMSGEIWMMFRCEMSMQEEDFEKLYCIEFTTDVDKLKRGLTHNVCDAVFVVDEINLSDVKAIYTFNYPDWYYAFVNPDIIYDRNNCAILTPFMMRKMKHKKLPNKVV